MQAGKSMTTRKKHHAVTRPPMPVGTASWITDQLNGIRTLERNLSKRLKSRAPQNRKVLLDRIGDLNQRIEGLDRALDEFMWSGSAA